MKRGTKERDVRNSRKEDKMKSHWKRFHTSYFRDRVKRNGISLLKGS
jgi:hypothetical protein